MKFNWKTILGITIVILVTYWMFLGFIPFSNGDLPTFNRAPNNWANYTDKLFFGNHTWKPDYDPEGLLSTLPAIASSLIGILIGKLLSSSMVKKEVKLLAT